MADWLGQEHLNLLPRGRAELVHDIFHGAREGSGARAAASGQRARRARTVSARALYERFRRPAAEFAKFAVIGGTGVLITNAVYGFASFHLGLGPVTSATVATVTAAVFTYLGNRYWSFRTRQHPGVLREAVIFAVLNAIGLLIQDAAVAFNSYLLHLEHHKLAAFIALNTGIVLATLFRFWSYRRFVWAAPAK